MDECWGPSIGHVNGPFAGSVAIGEGWLTKKQLRSPLFSRLFHNAYIPAAIPITHELPCRAVAAIAPEQTVLTGLSAAAVRGMDLAGAYDSVEVVIPEPVRLEAQRGINVRRTRREVIDSEPWREIRLASPMRMSLDLLTNTRLHRSLARVVGYLDAILRAGLVERGRLTRWLTIRHDNGIVRARRAIEMADIRSESIPESEVRVWLVTNGLAPEVQYNVYDEEGVFVARLDLAYPDAKIGVEYDGEWHDDDSQRRHDLRRRERLREAGWHIIVVKKEQLYGDPRGMVADIRRALFRKSALSMRAGAHATGLVGEARDR